MANKLTNTDNVKFMVETLAELKASATPESLLAAGLYLHAVVHKQDATAVDGGLRVAKWFDGEEGLTVLLSPPIDCLLSAVVANDAHNGVSVKDSLTAIFSRTVEEWEVYLDTLDMDTLYENSKKAVQADRESAMGDVIGSMLGGSAGKELGEKEMDAILSALPVDPAKAH
jgi:hypothetical protein